jgi:hypothetical protein
MQPLPTGYLLNPIGSSTLVKRVYFTAIFPLTQQLSWYVARISGVAVNVLKTSYTLMVGLEGRTTSQLGNEQVTEQSNDGWQNSAGIGTVSAREGSNVVGFKSDKMRT